jgi:hypothetical protein
MVVEPESLCWMTGRMVEARDGLTWAEEFARFPALRAVVRDNGTGLGKGGRLDRARRRAAGLPEFDDTLDVFHTLREGGRALRKTWGMATRALERADAAQKGLDRLGRQGQSRQGHGAPLRCVVRWCPHDPSPKRWFLRPDRRGHREVGPRSGESSGTSRGGRHAHGRPMMPRLAEDSATGTGRVATRRLDADDRDRISTVRSILTSAACDRIGGGTPRQAAAFERAGDTRPPAKRFVLCGKTRSRTNPSP